MSLVTEISPEDSAQASQHFLSRLKFETDCWDVHNAIITSKMDFVLLDVRSPIQFAKGHIPMAINLPYAKIISTKLAPYPNSTIFVTYCAGPHCNGAVRAAVKLAKLNRPVKIMLGGITGWINENFELVS